MRYERQALSIRPHAGCAALEPVRWAVIIGIPASLLIHFETIMNRPGILAAVAIYAAVVGFLSRPHAGVMKRSDGERLLLAADLLAAAAVTRLSGGILSPYFGLWYLATVHAALVLRLPAALGLSLAAAGAIITQEMLFPADPFVLLHLYTTVAKLSMLPLMAWVGSRVGRDLRAREVARRQAMRRLAASAGQEARTRKELAHARQVQESLLPGRVSEHPGSAAPLGDAAPHELPAPPGMSLAALFRPIGEVGGDLYDRVELPDGRLLVAVADVCGKGVPAALLAVAVQHGIRQFAGPDPAVVLAEVNRLLAGRCPDDMFVTACCAVVAPWDGRVLVANAGHPAPLRWNHGARQLGDTRMRRCLPLGLQPEWSGEAELFWLAPGDALLLYTDGVVDVKLGRRERLGTERLTQLLGQSAPDSAHQWLSQLLETLDGCAEWPDDVTALALVRALSEEVCRAA